MKALRLAFAFVLAGFLLSAATAWAQQPRQTYGMFGPRTLGGGLNPPGQGGIVVGPSGQFYGVYRHNPMLMFGGQPWRYTPRSIPLPPAPLRRELPPARHHTADDVVPGYSVYGPLQ